MAAFDPLVTPINVVLMGLRGQALRATPGVAEVQDADQDVVLDAQQGAGTTGAPVRFRGVELVKFKVLLTLWQSAHWQQWESFRTLVQTPPFGKLPSPLNVVHPWLVMANVSQAIVKKVGQPRMQDDMRGTIQIDLWQYRQPRVTFSTIKSEPEKPLSPLDQKLKEARTTLEQQRDLLAGKGKIP